MKKWCAVVIPTGIGHARNVLTVLGEDFIIALGGAAGTLSEICIAWIHNKPFLTSLTYPISYRQAHNLNWIVVIQAFLR